MVTVYTDSHSQLWQRFLSIYQDQNFLFWCTQLDRFPSCPVLNVAQNVASKIQMEDMCNCFGQSFSWWKGHKEESKFPEQIIPEKLPTHQLYRFQLLSNLEDKLPLC